MPLAQYYLNGRGEEEKNLAREKVSFSSILQQSICRQQRINSWCEKCNKYKSTVSDCLFICLVCLFVCFISCLLCVCMLLLCGHMKQSHMHRWPLAVAGDTACQSCVHSHDTVQEAIWPLCYLARVLQVGFRWRKSV